MMKRAWSTIAAAMLVLTMVGMAEAQKVTLFVANRAVDVAQAWYTSVPQHLGYFKEEGLEVDVQTTASGLEAAQFVVAGRGHFSLYPVVLDSGSARTAADLKGKKIGVTALGSATIPYIKAALAEGGLDPEKDLSFLAVGGGAQAAHALTSGSVDALGLWDSQYAAIDNVGVKLRRVPSKRLENYSRDERENKACGALSERDWQAYIDYLEQEKVIPGPVAAGDLITNQFVAAMNDFNAEQIRAKARAYQAK